MLIKFNLLGLENYVINLAEFNLKNNNENFLSL